MPTSRLFLVRHGQTASNVTQTLGAGEDDPLDATGEAQARAVAAWLAAQALPAPHVHASPYRRAQQTASAIAHALNVPLALLPGAQEFGVGTWAGRPYAHLQTHIHDWLHEDGTPGFPGGESLRGVAERFARALEPVLARSGTPIVVSHGGAITALLPSLLGLDPAGAWRDSRFRHPNTAVTELHQTGEGWRPVRLAETPHLAPVIKL